MSTVVKASYDHVYNQPEANAFCQAFYHEDGYAGEEICGREFRRVLLARLQEASAALPAGEKLKVMELGHSYGSSVMATIYGCTRKEIIDELETSGSKRIQRDRLIDCHVIGADIAENALAWSARRGISDQSVRGDFCKDKELLIDVARECDLLMMFGTTYYIDEDLWERMLAAFAEDRDRPGYVMVSFQHVEGQQGKLDRLKDSLLRTTTWIGSRSCLHRETREVERENCGPWQTLEVWCTEAPAGRSQSPACTLANTGRSTSGTLG